MRGVTNSFYGSRLGNSFRWFSFCGPSCGSLPVTALATATAERLFEALRVYESSTTTTTATSTATTKASATAERLFEALRVYCLVILSTDRGLVVLRFCKENEELRGAAVC